MDTYCLSADLRTGGRVLDTQQNHNKALVIAFYEAFNAGERERFPDILAADWVNHPADPGRENTPAGFMEAVGDFHAAFEGFRISREALVAEGDLVVCRITMSGRHVAALGTWQPDGNMTTFSGMDMHRIRDNRIVETWHFERMA